MKKKKKTHNSIESSERGNMKWDSVVLPHGWSVGSAGGSAVNTIHSGRDPVEAGLSHGTAHATIWCHSEDGNPHPQPQCPTE